MSIRRSEDVRKYWDNSDREIFNFSEAKYMPYGMKRRNALYEMFKNGMMIIVNGRSSLKTYEDPDLKKLIKQGKIEMVTAHDKPYDKYRTTYKRTYVRIKDGTK